MSSLLQRGGWRGHFKAHEEGIGRPKIVQNVHSPKIVFILTQFNKNEKEENQQKTDRQVEEEEATRCCRGAVETPNTYWYWDWVLGLRYWDIVLIFSVKNC
jgi:hypothetical protein